MAFGIKRSELNKWKQNVKNGQIDFLTHYWIDERFPNCTSVTKVGCSDLNKLIKWGKKYGLKSSWIDIHPKYPHFDLFGDIQKKVLYKEGLINQIERFNM